MPMTQACFLEDDNNPIFISSYAIGCYRLPINPSMWNGENLKIKQL